MPTSAPSVTHSSRSSSDLPDCFSELVIHWRHLVSLGLVEAVSERLILDRTDGCCGVELFGHLMAMWTFGQIGQRALQRAVRGHTQELSALLGLRRWTTQASMSRALKCVERESCHEFTDWLLTQAVAPADVELAEAAFHHDSFGSPWRVVDIDGRVRTFRQRKLPASDKLTPPKRHSDRLATPGYSGRKRGEVQYHQMVVQDAGAGRTLSLSMAPGNGEHRAEMAHAFQMVGRWADQLAIERAKAIARFDGKAAGVPALLACAKAGTQFVTRWTDYDLLEMDDFRETMRSAQWVRVPDSGSGPGRIAAEFGARRLIAFRDGRGADEIPASMVEARLIVTRFPGTEKRGCGRVIGGEQYEMYVTSLPADAWPAADVVALYYGRAAVENRFWQHDRETGSRHLISYEPGGQLLASAVACFVDLLRLHLGARLEPSPAVRPCREPRTVELAPPPDLPGPPPDVCSPVAEVGAMLTPPPTTPMKSGRPLRMEVLALLPVLPWHRILRGRPGWSWSRLTSEVQCPAGQPVFLRRAQQRKARISLDFKIRSSSTCGRCPLRKECSKSLNPRFVKELVLTVAHSDLHTARQAEPAASRSVPASLPQTVFAPAPSTPAEPGPFRPIAPSVVPTVERAAARQVAHDCRFRIRTVLDTPQHTQHPSPAAMRQHRRRERAQRLDQRLVPGGESLSIHVEFQDHIPGRHRRLVIEQLRGRTK